METRKRSLAKALSWRLLATLITSAVAFALTSEVVFAAKIGLLDTSVKLLAYFAHERVWVRVRFGRHEPGDYQI